MCFGTKTKTSNQQESEQSGTSQSNLFDTAGFQGALGNFWQQFSPQNIGAVTTGPNQWMTDAAGALGNLVGGAGSVFSNIANTGLDPSKIQSFISPYINAVVNPTLQAQQQQNQAALSDISGNMAMKGALGNNVGNRAAYMAGVVPQQNAVIGNLYNQGWGQALSGAMGSLQQQLSAAGSGVQGALGLGEMGEKIRNAALQGQLMPFQLTSQLGQSLAPWLQGAGVSFSGESSGSSKGSSTTSPGIGNIAAGLAGAFLMSDPRLKRNMRRVGQTDDGQPLYAYDFVPGLGLPEGTQVGLNAFDVAERDPGAVRQTPLGLAVNYDRALAGADGSNQPPAAADGGEIFDKVARAFNLINGIRRQSGGAVGGRPGFFLGGLTSTLFPQTQNLGTSPGGWSTSVTPASPLASPDSKKMGQSIMNLSQSLGDTSGAEQLQRQSQDALSSQMGGLSSMLQSISGREHGGRVGYDDGGYVLPTRVPGAPGIGGDPYETGGPGWSGREEAARPLLPPATGRGFSPIISMDEPSPVSSMSDPWPPRFVDSQAPALPASPSLAGEPPPSAWDITVSPTPAAAPAEAPGLPPMEGYPYLPHSAGLPPLPTAQPLAAAPAAGGTDRWSPVVERAAPAPSPAAEKSWWQYLLPSFKDGIFAGEAATPLQRLGIGLMAMSGPMVAGPWAHAALQMTEQDASRRRADREEQRHADQLRATIEHHRAMEQTPHIRNLIAAGLRPGTPQFEEALLKLIRQDRGETAWDVAGAQAGIKQATELGDQVQQANATVSRLDQLERLLGAPGVPSGAFANWHLEGKRIAKLLGFEVEGVEEAEAANTITNEMAMGMRSAPDAGMPGAMSDADRKFLVETVPGISRTPEGNRLIIAVMRERARYRAAANTEAIRFLQSARNPAGLVEHMTQWMAQNKMADVVPEHTATRRAVEAQVAATQERQPGPDGRPPAAAAAAPPAAAVTELQRARGTPEEARRIQQFNAAFNGGKPGLAERLIGGIDESASAPTEPMARRRNTPFGWGR